MTTKTKIITGILVIAAAALSIFLARPELFKGFTKNELLSMGFQAQDTRGSIDDLLEYVTVPSSVQSNGYINVDAQHTFTVKNNGKRVLFKVDSGLGNWEKLDSSSSSQKVTSTKVDTDKTQTGSTSHVSPTLFEDELNTKESELRSSEIYEETSIIPNDLITDPPADSMSADTSRTSDASIESSINTHSAIQDASTPRNEETNIGNLTIPAATLTGIQDEVSPEALPDSQLDSSMTTTDAGTINPASIPSSAQEGAISTGDLFSSDFSLMNTAYAASERAAVETIILEPGESVLFEPFNVGDEAVKIYVEGEFYLAYDIKKVEAQETPTKTTTSKTTTSTTPSPAPTDVKFNKNDKGLEISWTAPATDKKVASYTLYTITEYTNETAALTPATSVSTTSYLIAPEKLGKITKITAKVKANYSDKTDSDWSKDSKYTNAEQGSTPPENATPPQVEEYPAPTSLNIKENKNDGLDISWKAPDTDKEIASYMAIQDFEDTNNKTSQKTKSISPNIYDIPATKYEIEEKDLEDIKSIAIKVKAIYADGKGSDWSSTKSFDLTNAAPPDENNDNKDKEDDNDNNDKKTLENSNIKIKDFAIWPKGFNPTLVLTKASFKTSATALITIEIRSETGQKIVTLWDDKEKKSDDYEVYWDGTDNPDENKGKIVPPGTYKWKVIAKDPTTKAIKDTKSGDVNVIYNTGGADFEGNGTGSSGSSAGSGSQTTTSTTGSGSQSSQSNQEALAMISLQGATSGQTAGTGPEMFVYLLLPVAGLLFRKKR